MTEYKGIVHISLHPEYPPYSKVRSTKVEDSEFSGIKWMTVKLSNGVNRDVLAKEVRKL